MNEQETAPSTAPTAQATSGNITGLARVENIATDPNGKSSSSAGDACCETP